ncbi:class I SAM-dependent methyltransferase [Echinicola jeungdonensis]|uniref:Class I SAM-dependent methyltransferase n=1 Tax=Echinicola jeungdonensis TaxID=709343 RepID=A0ABV5J0Q0_9BACT
MSLNQINVLQNDLPAGSADFVLSTFGIKTFNREQQEVLASEIDRVLKPGGSFAFIEIPEPKLLFLKWFYKFYLKLIIPLIGRIFLGNARDYRMLGKYCASFKNSQYFHECLIKKGLESNYKNYFFGCATGVFGKKSPKDWL